MNKILFALTIILHFNAICQDRPKEVTPDTEKKIRLEIEDESAKFRLGLGHDDESALSNEFAVDTFRVEKYFEKYTSYDFSTVGMVTAGRKAANAYDSLLNKYYKKLLQVLEGNDKKTLIETQKAWIQFRDAEYRLIAILSDEKYSGGGTIQQLIDSSQFLNLVKSRLVQIFEHLDRIPSGD